MIVPSSENYVGRIAEGAIFPDDLIFYDSGYHNVNLITESGELFEARALTVLITQFYQFPYSYEALRVAVYCHLFAVHFP